MSIIDSKNFANGGMDSDSAFELIDKNDYIEAFNIRNTGNALNEEGYVVSIESNTPLPLVLPSGVNKGIGANQFENVRKIYKFIYNSQNKHLITEIDYDSNTETILFTNLVDSAGVDVLNLTVDGYITDIKLVDDLLIFRNSLDEPCLININKLKNKEYGVVTKDDFLLIKQPPSITPKSVYGKDSKFYTNLLHGKLFQFRHQFIYDDEQSSVWGSISGRAVPEGESNPNIGSISINNNCLIVTVDIGSNRVEEINIATRQGNLDWYYIKNIKRSTVLALTNTSVNLDNEVYESYDPLTNLYSFVFYNNGLYAPIDVLETDLLQDYIPNKSEALEVINGRGDVNSNGSILTLANNTEGYPRPSVDAKVGITAYDPQINAIPPSTNPLKVVPLPAVRLPNSSIRECLYQFYGVPALNDYIEIYLINLDGTFVEATYELTVTATDVSGGLLSMVTRYASIIASKTFPISTTTTVTAVSVSTNSSGVVELRFKTRSDNVNPGGRRTTSGEKPPLVRLSGAGSGEVKSIQSIKMNSSYQLALAYYDRHGRAFPIQTNTLSGDNGFVLKTNPYAKYNGKLPLITWSINGAPPAGAETYQWLISPNNTHLKTLYVAGKIAAASSGLPIVRIDLKSLNKYQENNPESNVVYDFAKGDRVSFCYYLSDDDVTRNWFDGISNPLIDVEVADYEVEIDPDDENNSIYDLIIRTPSTEAITAINTAINKNILFEIYTPINSTAQLDNTIFYEVGDRYKITNNQHTVLSGTISKADTYYKTRAYNKPSNINTPPISFFVEDFNFSDFYPSKFNNYGRPRSYYDTPEGKKFPVDIRYSYELVSDSKINLINRFYGENKVTYDFRYAGIKKLFQRDNTLVCIQETKVGYIPINISIIEDQIAQQNVATSTKLLNKIRYSDSGNMGIGDAVESFAEYSGAMYFVDPNRSEPIQISYNGIRPISVKMSKYFKNTLKEAYDKGLKIIGYYNIYNKEYIVTIETEEGFINQLTFNDTNWQFEETYTVNKDTLSISTSPTKGVLSSISSTGTVDYTGNIGASGSDSFNFTFTPNGGSTPVTKKVCLNITAGVTDVYQFILGSITNQPLSAYSSPSTSVSDLGNTAPVAISISSGGQYRINGGAWVSTSGFYYPEDEVQVRVMTSSSPNTATTTTLTIGSKSSVFTATTVIPVVVNYSLTKDDNPFVDIVLVPLRNGTNLGNIYPTSTGVFSGTVAGDSIYMGIVHQLSYQPWPAGASASLVIKKDGVNIFNSGSITNPSLENLASHTFTLQAGSVYDVIAVSNSTSTLYSPSTFSMSNLSSAPLSTSGEVVSFEITDNTTSQFVLFTGQYTQPQNNIGFNWLTDANTGKIKVQNNSLYDLEFTLTNVSYGGSYNNTITILSGTFGQFLAIPKTSYNISYVDFISP
jgi:hypothetical protein